jgi:hypothetical protein
VSLHKLCALRRADAPQLSPVSGGAPARCGQRDWRSSHTLARGRRWMTHRLRLRQELTWLLSVEPGQSTVGTYKRSEATGSMKERSWPLDIERAWHCARKHMRLNRGALSATFGTRCARLRDRMGCGLRHGGPPTHARRSTEPASSGEKKTVPNRCKRRQADYTRGGGNANNHARNR